MGELKSKRTGSGAPEGEEKKFRVKYETKEKLWQDVRRPKAEEETFSKGKASPSFRGIIVIQGPSGRYYLKQVTKWALDMP